MVEGKIRKVSGPLVIAEGMREADLFDVVRVGPKKLIGEIIEMHGHLSRIQGYEDTAGLGRGAAVVSTGVTRKPAAWNAPSKESTSAPPAPVCRLRAARASVPKALASAPQKWV